MPINREQDSNISRRHFLRSSTVITAGLLLTTKDMFARTSQTSPVIQMKNAIAKSPVTVKKIKEHFYVLEGAGGNIERSLKETIASKPTAAFDAKFGNFVVDPATFTKLVYADV